MGSSWGGNEDLIGQGGNSYGDWSPLTLGMYFCVGGLSLKAAMKGCTTISECSIVEDGKNNLGVMDIKLRRFQCNPASALARVISGFAPPDTLFLPVLSGFILEKVLF